MHDKTSVEQLAQKYLPREYWEPLCQVALANNVVYPYLNDDNASSTKKRVRQPPKLTVGAKKTQETNNSVDDDEDDFMP